MTNDWHEVEEMLRNYYQARKEAAETLEETTRLLTPSGLESVKDDYIYSKTRTTAKLDGSKVQRTKQSDEHIVTLVNGMGDYMAYTVQSLRRRQERAAKEVQRLDNLLEAIEKLPGKQRDIIKRSYFGGSKTQTELAKELGYNTRAGMTSARDSAIGKLVRLMRSP